MKHFDFRRCLLRAALQPVLVRGANKCLEHGMRLERLRLELGMELASDEVRMVFDFHHLDVGPVGR